MNCHCILKLAEIRSDRQQKIFSTSFGLHHSFSSLGVAGRHREQSSVEGFIHLTRPGTLCLRSSRCFEMQASVFNLQPSQFTRVSSKSLMEGDVLFKQGILLDAINISCHPTSKFLVLLLKHFSFREKFKCSSISQAVFYHCVLQLGQ